VTQSCEPRKTIFSRFIRWSEMGVFGRIVLAERRRTKQQTIQNRRLSHQRQAA